MGAERGVGHLGQMNRQEWRRLREIADGRVYATVSWPKTFARLVQRGLAEHVVHAVKTLEFCRITDAGRAALARASAAGTEGGGDA